ncbi:hypothetical protein OMP44_10690 [Pseudomonas sp. CBMAI 2609]|uniref:Uncharacterized protein n=1 Tax=Pseudomonas flavocrustae TaxID=2991719 RepID=A0ABT6IH54_9PSED|nr:hypothetical protein [Pseudomonas sp. CBMAI 2609]MDH4763364.1 hypothetical protein [Pseudomonas sp. CBMAI 2609]
MIHVLKKDSCKFDATLLHRLGSACTTVFARIACFDRNGTLFGYGLQLSSTAKHAAVCAHDVIIVVLYGIIPNGKKMDDVQNALFLSGQFSTRNYLYCIFHRKHHLLLSFLGRLYRAVHGRALIILVQRLIWCKDSFSANKRMIATFTNSYSRIEA